MMVNIVAVTDRLTTDMAHADVVIKSYDKMKINDRDHYAMLTGVLENLAVAILAATSSNDGLIGKKVSGARFNISSQTNLAGSLSEVVEYLRDDVAGTLAGELSYYKQDNAIRAMGSLKMLFNVLRRAILNEAQLDLMTVADRGVSEMIAAAQGLAAIADQVDSTGLPGTTSTTPGAMGTLPPRGED